jgi:hypothetical protein
MNGNESNQAHKGQQEESTIVLLFLKENQCGKIKGRVSINEALQRVFIPREEVLLPTVSTELMFIMLAIAANKKRHVRCYEVLNIFVNMDIDENVHMVLKGELTEMMVHIAPQIYCKHITVDKKGMPVLYVKLQKALYGLMRVSLLFYRELKKELEDFGFVVNPYNPCVVNKDVGGGKQLTVIWHVDDLMESCVVNFKLTKLLCYLPHIYGPKLTMHMGNKHDYLVVDLKFQHDGPWLGIPIFGSDFWDPILSRIPIPFVIPKIPVGFFFEIPMSGESDNWNSDLRCLEFR